MDDRPDEMIWSGRPIALRVADVVPRARVKLRGVIVSARAGHWRGVRTFMCELEDSTGSIGLRFMGRSQVPGMGEGTRCRVEGTALPESGGCVLWNPLLDLEGPEISSAQAATSP
jgi:hypothetical protein